MHPWIAETFRKRECKQDGMGRRIAYEKGAKVKFSQGDQGF